MPITTDDLLVTTDVLRQKKAEEQIRRNVGLYDILKKKGRFKPHRGGRKIQIEISRKENEGFQYQAEYERMSTRHTQPLSTLEYDIKIATTPITISDLEEHLNRGNPKNLGILAQRIENAEQTEMNQIGAVGLYSDGSAFGGKQINGLQSFLPADNTTGVIGTIDRATNPFWRHQIVNATTEFGGPKDVTNLKRGMGRLERRATVNGQRPDCWIMDNEDFELYESATQAIQRIMDSRTADVGYRTLEFHGRPVIFDGGLGGGCPANTTFALNAMDFDFYHVPERYMRLLPKREPIDQLASIRYRVCYMNLTCKRLRHSGRFTN